MLEGSVPVHELLSRLVVVVSPPASASVRTFPLFEKLRWVVCYWGLCSLKETEAARTFGDEADSSLWDSAFFPLPRRSSSKISMDRASSKVGKG